MKPTGRWKSQKGSSNGMHKNYPAARLSRSPAPCQTSLSSNICSCSPGKKLCFALERCWDWFGEAAGTQNKTSPDYRSFQHPFSARADVFSLLQPPNPSVFQLSPHYLTPQRHNPAPPCCHCLHLFAFITPFAHPYHIIIIPHGAVQPGNVWVQEHTWKIALKQHC